MANQTTHFRCPNCGGDIQFNPTLQLMTCDYCGGQFSPQDIEMNENFNNRSSNTEWDSYTSQSGNGDWQQGEADHLSIAHCSYCGGEIICDTNTAATSCPYCANPVVLTERVSGMLRPDFVIPFKYTREQAINALQQHCKGKRLLPREFLSKHNLENVTGIYVPFWLFSCDSDASIRYKATRVHRWSDRKYDYTRTDHYALLRDGTLRFDNVPVDGSVRMPDAYMESIEPFDYSEMIDFNSAYLAGYLADRYDVRADEAIPRANQRINNSTVEKFRETCIGYTTVTPMDSNLYYHNPQTRYALLPVWMLNTQYNGKTYTFAMNGQSGKFVGELPLSRARYWLYWLISLIISLPISAVLMYIIMMLLED